MPPRVYLPGRWVHNHRSIETTGRARGATVPVADLFELSRPWYGDRLDPDRVKPTTEELQANLTRAGLTGPFWSLAG